VASPAHRNQAARERGRALEILRHHLRHVQGFRSLGVIINQDFKNLRHNNELERYHNLETPEAQGTTL